MNHFSLQVPAAQLVLDNHAHTRKQQEIANQAVLEAVQAYAAFHEVAPSVVFGCPEGTFSAHAQSEKTAMQAVLGAGIPIYDIRIATVEFLDAMARAGTDAAFQLLVESFESGAPITSLSGPGPLTASQAILNVNAQVRSKIEAANTAILDAVKAYVDCGDPMAPYVFGIPLRVLRGLAETSRAKLLGILMTSVPIFSLREPLLAANEGDHAGDIDDAALIQLLKSFSSTLLAA